MTFDSYSNVLFALCLWREARGESKNAKVAIKHVLLNRAADPKGPYAKCKDVISNVLCPFQFSSFMPHDPNSTMLPDPKHGADWNAWRECCEVIDESDPDPTGGANYYFDSSISAPSWALPIKQTCIIGRLRFFKI